MKSEKILKILSYLVVASVSVLITVMLFVIPNWSTRNITPSHVSVSIGDTPISEYTIYYSGLKAKPAAQRLHDVIYKLTGKNLKVTRGYSQGKAIDIVVTDAELEIFVADGTVSISAGSEEECIRAVNVFANTYLGYSFAGEEREHILDGVKAVKVPANVESVKASASWIPEREPIICLWKTNIARGQYYNTDAALTSEIMTYSNDQLYEYVKMMKYCGFTGIQVTDMCSTWAVYGGYEYVHEKIRFLADAAHSLDMKFTLWVWGSEFTGYGWSDSSVVYHSSVAGQYAYESEEVLASFNKYYSIYAELADCSDRIIAHYDDPGQITDSSEIGYFAALLRNKVRAVNPNIDFGVSDYTCKFDKYAIADYLGTDFTLYSGASTYKTSDWKDFRSVARNLGVNLGVWSWNLVEMEIDQIAEMDVNADIIKDVYLRTRDDDSAYKPTYWSEMESYHVANIFSLYCAGQLLIDPEQDTETLLREISKAVVGDEYADSMYEILTIIEDARAGDSFEEFRFGNDEYLRTSDKYPSADVLARCKKYYPVLEEMIDSDIKGNTIPLPVSVTDLLKVVRTHLKQIMEFAEFRVNLDEIKAEYYSVERPAATDGEDTRDTKPDDYEIVEAYEAMMAEVTAKLEAISGSIPNYDALIGAWGQPEALAQYKLLDEFCKEIGIETPKDKVYVYYRKQYMFEEMIALQKNSATRLTFTKDCSSIWSFAYGEETAIELVNLLEEDGLVTRNEDGTVYLTNWETYVFYGTGASNR